LEIKDSFTKLTKEMIINKIVEYLDKNPEENMDKIFNAIRFLTKDEFALSQIDCVYNYYKNDKSKHDFIQNILKNTDKNV